MLNRKLLLLFLICSLAPACSKREPAPFYIGNKAQTRAEYPQRTPVYYKTTQPKKQTYKTPQKTVKKNKSDKYTVQKNDTLYSIARDNNISLSNLIKANNLQKPYNIYSGQELYLSGDRSTYSTKPKDTAFEKVPARSQNKFTKPINGKTVSTFGSKNNGLKNDGINIAAKKGTPIKAAENGIVVYSSDKIKGLGNIILIKHDGGWITAYAHLEKSLVEKGQIIRRGTTIGTVGDTGSVDSPQLHFEIRKDSKPVNPVKYF